MLHSLAGRAVVLASLCALQPAVAQRAAMETPSSAPITGVRYEVTADRAGLAERQLHVVTTFGVAGTAPVILSLPAWTPGAYEISNFARGPSSEFGATQGADTLALGQGRLRHVARAAGRRAQVDACRSTVTADSLDNAMSWTTRDFALFNGTNLFLYPEGRSTRLRGDGDDQDGARVARRDGMPRAPEARTFRAANYHDLVDMPFFVGQFDVDSARGRRARRCASRRIRAACSAAPRARRHGSRSRDDPATGAGVRRHARGTATPSCTSSTPRSAAASGLEHAELARGHLGAARGSAASSCRRSTRTRSSTRGT